MEFNKVLRERRSTRKYSSEQITKAELDEILLAGINAPIGSNLYKDIHITVIQDKDVMAKMCAAANLRLKDRAVYEKLAGEIIAGGKELPQPIPFYGAPTVIIVSHRAQTIQPGIEYANVTSVVHTMHLAATNLGLGSVYVWGILESMRLNPELDRTALLNLPDDFFPLMGLMVGYPANPLVEQDFIPEKIPVNYI